MKFSPAQKRFLCSFTTHGYSWCPSGYAGCAQDASAWWRTMQSLQSMGLVYRPGLSSTALLTWLGLAWTVELLKEAAHG